jgi:hypothetical protein
LVSHSFPTRRSSDLAAERRHANLQQVYVALVRRRLAQSYPLIEHNLERQRRRK